MSDLPKHLSLLRHANAVSDYSNSDADRVLSAQGINESRMLGQYMQSQSMDIDIVLCSPAKRTQQTLEYLSEAYTITNTVSHDILYNGSVGDYLYLIQSIDNEYKHPLIIAHNPSIYELVILLAAQGEDTEQEKISQGYAPATLSKIECACDLWKDIQPAENILKHVKEPSNNITSDTPRRWM